MCATLTRQRNGSPLDGMRMASCVMPPPFFQGVAVKEDLRMICSLELGTPVFYGNARSVNPTIMTDYQFAFLTSTTNGYLCSRLPAHP